MTALCYGQLDEIPPTPCPAKHAAPSSVTTEGVTTGTIAIEGECRQSESIKSLEMQFVGFPLLLGTVARMSAKVRLSASPPGYHPSKPTAKLSLGPHSQAIKFGLLIRRTRIPESLNSRPAITLITPIILITPIPYANTVSNPFSVIYHLGLRHRFSHRPASGDKMQTRN